MSDAITKKNLTTQLKSHARKITFIKANGSKRVMEATLVPSEIPEVIRQTNNPDIITVYDRKANAGKGGWKSIRLDSIQGEPTLA